MTDVSTIPPGKVYLIGEDHERMQPILKELDARGIPTEVWNTMGGTLVSTREPPRGVFFCRQSPSAWARGNTSSATYARELLRWLEFHGRRVINGSTALDIETSKSMQMMYLTAAGLNTPFTALHQGLAQTSKEAATTFRHEPVILKPNHGGSGKGIQSFESGGMLAESIRDTFASMQVLSCDNLWVTQALLGEHTDDVSVMKSILRFEVMDGKVQRDYILQIRAPATEFSLCPCDPRSSKILTNVEFKMLQDPLRISGFRDDQPAFDAFCAKIEHAFATAGALVGSVEGMVLIDRYPELAEEYPTPHEPVLFEMNLNTNYNEIAETKAGVKPGVIRLVDMLEREYNLTLLH